MSIHLRCRVQGMPEWIDLCGVGAMRRVLQLPWSGTPSKGTPDTVYQKLQAIYTFLQFQIKCQSRNFFGFFSEITEQFIPT